MFTFNPEMAVEENQEEEDEATFDLENNNYDIEEDVVSFFFIENRIELIGERSVS